MCLNDLGKYEESFKSYERALELAPREEEYLSDYVAVLVIMGVLRQERKISEDAIHAFWVSDRYKPGNASAWNPPGTCRKEIDRDEEPGKAYKRARSISRLNREHMFRHKREHLV